MNSKIIINAVDPEECRIAKVVDNKLEEFHIETASMESCQGNIYKAIITRVEPSLQAVFVDFGADRHGFLQRQEIHSDYFMDTEKGDRTFTSIIKKGMELMVQVTKDPIMKKGAMLTTFISLAGRHTVLMPGSTSRGVSRKITDEKERKRLKEIITGLTLPEGFGIIVRTAGKDVTKTLMSKDLRYLMRLWKDITKKGVTETTPAILYKERNLSVRSIRDYFTADVGEILIDDLTIFKEVKAFVTIIEPKQAQLVKHHKSSKPIFTKHQLEQQISSIYESRVSLKSGGSIVIDQTEALVAVDVNSGRATQKNSIEATALAANLEAAEEIARQLRLRDLGGLIVIDFIDMKDAKHKAKVESTMKTCLKIDKARTKVGRISRFGLMEMSRQRIRPSIEFGRYVACEHCRGKGMVPSTEALSIGFLRKLSLETHKGNMGNVKVLVPEDVATYLLNRKRSEILDLEMRRDITITIEPDSSMLPGDNKIICEKEIQEPLPRKPAV